jgi:membrane protein implicated in regulation of membrane protease activity
MDKREFNAAMVGISVAVVGVIGAAAMLAHVAGPEAAGALFLVAAGVIAWVSRRAYLRAREAAQEQDTAEQVARAEQARQIAESGRQALDRTISEFERLQKQKARLISEHGARGKGAESDGE